MPRQLSDYNASQSFDISVSRCFLRVFLGLSPSDGVFPSIVISFSPDGYEVILLQKKLFEFHS